ncbi:uncharacterized protein LOC118559015 [Fundulus heteroclitus]|uniref:uncharacterized protein LOC118559015 n=1 Tax=Fundulus heteroclitus TaxID=8078 RepID=UPI00165A64E8|nr:uncharacterized protein LOC118559015 [Fundulus heteroclitus]
MLQGADKSRMDTFDDATLSVLEAASVDEEALKGLSRDDLRDLFPGPQNFLKRKKLWNVISENFENTTDQDANNCAMPPCQPQTSTPISAEKKMKMPDPPEYVVYTDSELDMVRSQYFALLCNGKEKNYTMSKELCCRLIRNTITSMVAILRASPMGKEVRYPSKLEMRAMSQKIVDYYPMLRDDDPNMPYLTIYAKMYKRLQNMRSPRKRQGSVPQRGVAKTALFSADNQETDWTSNSSDNTVLLESNDDLSEDNSSAASPAQRPPSVPRKPKTKTSLLPSASASGSSLRTVIASPTTPAKDDVVAQDSLKMQARHYKTLSNMYNKPNAKPNQSDVAQVLDLEFKARRAFIDADVTREEDRPAKIFEAYPCFRDVRNAMDELRRIVGGTNSRYIEEVKGRWADFCAKVQFYGVWKKALKPPFPLDVRGVEFTLAIFNALPSLFPSPTSPPKKLGNSCEALLHVLKSGEDPTLYLEKRPLSSPVLLSDGSTTIVAVVIQTEVIGDTIHDQDATSAYKKAMADWKSFIEK